MTYALGAAVPVVVAGLSEDKPEIEARFTWSDAGIGCPSQLVRDAVNALPAEPPYATQLESTAGLAPQPESSIR